MTIFAWCVVVAFGILFAIGTIMIIISFVKFIIRAFDTWFVKESMNVYGIIIDKYETTRRVPFGCFLLPVGTTYTFDIKVYGDTDSFSAGRKTYDSMNIGNRISVDVICGRFSQRFYIRAIYV